MHHGLRITPVRDQVLGVFLSRPEAIGQQQVEDVLGQVDRITLYRTLRSFEEAGIIHRVPADGPSPRWAMCHDRCSDHGHNDHHAHFHCTRCDRTLCLDSIEVPVVAAPKGFVLNDAKLVLSGTCDACV
jgi:Fur family ferric uptake transcriptional regulator